MNTPTANVGTGPSDPDPPPPPKIVALLDAVRRGAAVYGQDEHLLVEGVERWLLVDEVDGWILVDAFMSGAVRLEHWVLELLRQHDKDKTTARRVSIPRRGAFTLRPVLQRSLDGMPRLYVGLCAS